MSDTGSGTRNEDGDADRLTQEDVERVLDYLLSHKMAFAQELLRARGLPFSGSKARLRQRMQGYLDQGDVQTTDLVQLLNHIEGWGNQHIYLYKGPDPQIRGWVDEDVVKAQLAALGLGDLLNRQRPLVLPEEPTLSSIEWTPERVRFVWIEKRAWEERIPDEDIIEGDKVWRAYRINVARGLVAFDWDLVSGYAMLMIQRLPRGTRYHQIRDRFEDALQPIVGLRQFERVRISGAIQRIEMSDEVRRRQLAYRASRGGKVAFTSASSSRDTFADPDLERAGQIFRGKAAGVLGNFYWLPVKDRLRGELHAKLYARDHRVGIFGEHEELGVRYVLSRIRHYCV